MKIILLSIGLLLTSCNRSSTQGVAQEIKSITGESVVCFEITNRAGWLCRSDTKKNYYCPFDSSIDCWFTTRLMLLDPLIEAPLSTH